MEDNIISIFTPLGYKMGCDMSRLCGWVFQDDFQQSRKTRIVTTIILELDDKAREKDFYDAKFDLIEKFLKDKTSFGKSIIFKKSPHHTRYPYITIHSLDTRFLVNSSNRILSNSTLGVTEIHFHQEFVEVMVVEMKHPSFFSLLNPYVREPSFKEKSFQIRMLTKKPRRMFPDQNPREKLFLYTIYVKSDPKSEEINDSAKRRLRETHELRLVLRTVRSGKLLEMFEIVKKGFGWWEGLEVYNEAVRVYFDFLQRHSKIRKQRKEGEDVRQELDVSEVDGCVQKLQDLEGKIQKHDLFKDYVGGLISMMKQCRESALKEAGLLGTRILDEKGWEEN